MKTLTSQVFKSTEIVTWWNQNLTAHRQQQNGRENATIVEIMKYFRLIWPLEWFDPHTHKKQNNSYEMHKIGIVAAMNEAPMCQNHDLIWNSSWNPIKCANGLNWMAKREEREEVWGDSMHRSNVHMDVMYVVWHNAQMIKTCSPLFSEWSWATVDFKYIQFFFLPLGLVSYRICCCCCYLSFTAFIVERTSS